MVVASIRYPPHSVQDSHDCTSIRRTDLGEQSLFLTLTHAAVITDTVSPVTCFTFSTTISAISYKINNSSN